MKERAHTLHWFKPLNFTEAIRALVCLIPMLIALLTGQTAALSSLGQGGFYYSYLPLSKNLGSRILSLILLLSVGLGFYLIGGNVAPYKWLAVLYTFGVGIILVLLSGWKIIGALAFSFISLYAAGLNASSPEKATINFMAFSISILWAGLISLLPIWKGKEHKKQKKVDDITYYETAFKMGFGTSIALVISYFFGWAKLGWPVSGVGNVIRFDLDTSKKRANLRMLGTVIGVFILAIVFTLTSNIAILVISTFIYAFLNGLLKETKFGTMVIFYTAMILTLYTLDDISQIGELSFFRILENLVGVLVGLFIVIYPFPRIYPRIHSWIKKSLEIV